MRIALDASFLHLPPSGTATYTRHLANALQRLDPSLDLHLLEPSWPDESASAPSRRQRLTWEMWTVQSSARQVDPDILHIPHLSAPLIPPTSPLVVTVHDVIPLVLAAYRSSRAMAIRLAVQKQTIRRARLILTPSRHAASDIHCVLRVPMERIRVISEAADPAYRPPADDVERAAAESMVRSLGIQGRYIFNVGGFDIRKNLQVLVEAYAQALPHLGEPVSLVIAGAPHSSNQAVFPPLDRIIGRHGMAGKVILPGFVSEAVKISLYQCASLYVTPSSYEGFGLTALEAMACGVPTIAADCTSLPEVIGSGGVLVPPEADPLATAIVSVMNDRPYAAALRHAAVARAACFSWEETARQTLAAYREAVHR